jgi:3-deoxy-manno-octulosonate cytidylyltransferase (CMP-KDO synthetase)
MIQHVYTRAAAAQGVDAVVVATDDERIAQAVQAFGGVVRMTRRDHRTGLDRIAEVAADLDCEIVVNVQGDEPLIEPRAIAEVLVPFDRDPSIQMTTLRRRITDAAELNSPHVVKVVVDLEGNALYFSRAPIPSVRGPLATELPKAGPYETQLREYASSGSSGSVFKHVGLYAYRRAFVRELAALPQTPLECVESLEQLRALEHGFDIYAVETHYDSIGVDTPEDLERVRRQLSVGVRT